VKRRERANQEHFNKQRQVKKQTASRTPVDRICQETSNNKKRKKLRMTPVLSDSFFQAKQQLITGWVGRERRM